MINQPGLIDERAAKTSAPLIFKVASEDWEFEQVLRLNYKTFVEEIPQHEANPDGLLVDKFHHENTYFICVRGGRLVGMVAARDQRPFSLDQKLESLDSYMPPGKSICEIRLLSIDKEHRDGRIIQGLLTMLARHCVNRGYGIAIISGTVRQERFYRRLGFVPFGPRVGTPAALYQPMYRELASLEEEFSALFGPKPPSPVSQEPVNLLPGPVGIRREVQKAFAQGPVSHRAPQFVADLKRVKRRLSALVGSRHVEILMGSGTAANDAIAAQLSLGPGRGLIVSNGEFGDRLLDHAGRMRLKFDALRVDWGSVIRRDIIEAALDRGAGFDWLWAVHCETSTGVLNDLGMLKDLCTARQVRLVMDCISSIGTVAVDLGGVYLGSCVSGKGLGAFPGLSMVFHDHEVLSTPNALPRYLDLGLYAEKDGVPFTMSSNLLYALDAALDRFQSDVVFAEITEASTSLRRGLRELGYGIVAPDDHSSPAVITVELPEEASSSELGRRLEEAGYFLSYNSAYLLQRNWIQVCLMGEISREAVAPLLQAMRGCVGSSKGSQPLIPDSCRLGTTSTSCERRVCLAAKTPSIS